MRKTVEIEYVGIEDVQEIMDDALALMKEGHYVNVEMSNYSGENIMVRCNIILGGIKVDGGLKEPTQLYDYSFYFYMSEDADDVKTMDNCKNTLRNLLAED